MPCWMQPCQDVAQVLQQHSGTPACKYRCDADLLSQLNGLHIEATPLVIGQPLLCRSKVQVGLVSDLFGQTGQPVPVLGKQLDNLQPGWPGIVIAGLVPAPCLA